MSSSQEQRPIANNRARIARVIAIASIPLITLIAFQNCGAQKSKGQLVPVSSPFYTQRVHLNPNEATFAKPSQNGEIPVTLIVNNRCAIDLCSQDGIGDSVVCRVTKDRIVKELEDYVQGYDWSVPQGSTESSVEATLVSNQADHDCTIGVALTQEYKTSQVTNDPQRGAQWHHAVLQTDEAMAFFGNSLPSVNIGLIDTGIDRTHEDLGSLGGLEWISYSETCATICNFHGTFIGGIIKGTKNNAKGGYGLAPNARIYSVRVGDANGSISSTQLYNAINFFVSVGTIEILNLSLGGTTAQDQSIQDGLVRLIDQDILVVVAAGNDGRDLDQRPIYPAAFNYDGQINVASAGPSTINPDTPTPDISGPITLDPFSNYNAGIVHIAAPGRAIYSTTLNNAYTKSSGTSFATPMVVGALVVLKGYLKSKGYTNPSASVLKQLLLDGSRTVSGLTTQVNGGKYLNLMSLKTVAETFIATISGGGGPASIAIVSSETVLVNGKKVVRVKIDVTGGTPGHVVKVYTNKAFLTQSYTGLSCTITQARQFCDFEIPFDSLLVDPGIYFTLTNADGSLLVNDLNVPKTALNFGVRADAALIGEISLVRAVPGYFHAEGWTCLVGFTDEINIEVRKGSRTGPIVRHLKTIRQARGDFFNRCQAAGTQFGFTFVVPSTDLTTSSTYFFIARHLDTGKILNLPVTSYQPGYNDATPARYVESIYVDALAISDRPVVKFTKREFKDWILTVEGSICHASSKRPAVARIFVSAAEMTALIPELWDSGDGANTNATPVLAAAYKSESYLWDFPNPHTVTQPPNLGAVGCNGSFSDITYPCSYSGDYRAPGRSIAHLQPLPFIYSPILSAPGQPIPANTSNDYIISGATAPFGAEIQATIDLADGCPYPSGFRYQEDMRKIFGGMSLSHGFTYRSDLIDRATAISRAGIEPAFLTNQPDRTFDGLRFRSRAFDVTLQAIGGQAAVIIGAGQNLFFAREAVIVHSAATPGWVFYKQTRHGTDFEIWTHKDFTKTVLGDGLGAALSQVYASPQITLKNPGSTRMLLSMDYQAGSKFGALGTDFRVEFAINGSSQWYEMPIDVVYNTKGTDGLATGRLDADFDFPAGANTVRLRVRANDKNAFTISGLGFMTE